MRCLPSCCIRPGRLPLGAALLRSPVRAHPSTEDSPGLARAASFSICGRDDAACQAPGRRPTLAAQDVSTPTCASRHPVARTWPRTRTRACAGTIPRAEHGRVETRDRVDGRRGARITPVLWVQVCGARAGEPTSSVSTAAWCSFEEMGTAAIRHHTTGREGQRREVAGAFSRRRKTRPSWTAAIVRTGRDPRQRPLAIRL